MNDNYSVIYRFTSQGVRNRLFLAALSFLSVASPMCVVGWPFRNELFDKCEEIFLYNLFSDDDRLEAE